MNSIKSILIVEDDHDTRVALRQSLENAKYVVYSASNGLDALNLLKKNVAPDLILLDLRMPLMNGEDFLKIKNSLETLADIPVMIITAHKDKLSLVPDQPFMKKPLDLDKLLQVIPDCIKGRSADPV